MPKMKARSSAKKRFNRLGSGLIKRAKAYRRHLLTKKARGTKRHLRHSAYIHQRDDHKIIQLLANR
jgi:large subunit ribosomal protein L35